MSHRDRIGEKVRLNSGSLKTALSWLLRGTDWQEVSWRSDCTWTARLLSITALLWAWSDEETIVERFSTARKITLHMYRPVEKMGETYQGFMKLLQRWGACLILALEVSLRKRMMEDFSTHMKVAGFLLFAVDGSRVELPRTAAHERVFSCSKKRTKANRKNKQKRKNKSSRQRNAKKANEKKSEKPAMWITTLWHVGTGLPWDWRLGPTDSSERAHWMDMLKAIPEPAMFVGDAGFVGYEYAAAVINANHQLTIRVGAHVTLLKKLGYARESNGLVYLWPDKSAKRKGLPPLVFRLVVVHNGKHPLYLITSVTDERELSDEQVVEIYKKRWGIELFYRHLKQTFGKRKLRSTSPGAAYVEMDWAVAGFWCMGMYGLKELIKSGINPCRMSMAKLIKSFRRMMRDYLHPIEKKKSFCDLLREAVMDDYQRGDKTSREYPQKKHEKPPGKPIIRNATAQERQLAKQTKTQQEIGLTA